MSILSRSDSFVVGNTTFDFRHKGQVELVLAASSQQSLFKTSQFNLQLSDPKVTPILKFMLTCNTQVIQARNFQQPNVIRDIITCKFTNLRILNLRQNNITNIEFIQFIDMPTVSYLYLGSNCICTAKPLSKMDFAILKTLGVQANFVNQMDFSRIRTNHTAMSQIILELKGSEKPQFEDLRVLFKCQPQKIKSIVLGQDPKKIMQTNIKSKLSRRHQKIVFLSYS